MDFPNHVAFVGIGHYLIGFLLVSASLGILGFVGKRHGGTEARIRRAGVALVYWGWGLYTRGVWFETGIRRWMLIAFEFVPLLLLILVHAPELEVRQAGGPVIGRNEQP
jgi:hypothetical protein